MKIIAIILFIINSLTVAYAESTYSSSWMTIDDKNSQYWNISNTGGKLEGRHYCLNSIKKSQYKVLILCSKESSSYVIAFNKILDVVKDKLPTVEFIFFNFNNDFDRASDIVKFGINEGIDLIMSIGSEAMIFCYENLKGASIPIVTCINKDPFILGFVNDYISGSGSNIAYTSVNVPLNVIIEWIYKLRPSLKAITVLYDPYHSSVVTSEVKPLKKYLDDHDISYFDGAVPSGPDKKTYLINTISSSKEHMNQVDPGLKNSLFWLTSSTNLFSEMKTISENTGIIPVVSSVPNTVNDSADSAMLALGIDRRNSANLAALYMIEILTGKTDPGKLPVGVVTPPDISISFKTAKRIGETIPFDIFENANFIYDYEGIIIRSFGKNVTKKKEN